MAEAASPDALRLSRLDRLIDQLGNPQRLNGQPGEQQAGLALRSAAPDSWALPVDRARAGTLEGRMSELEQRLQSEVQALWPLKEVDVRSELTAARVAIDKLTKQVTLLGRDQEEARIRQEVRLQQVEQRQAEAELRLERLTRAVEEERSELAAAVEELRGGTRGMLSEVIGSIADQFDAVQAALDDTIAGRQRDRAAAEDAAAARIDAALAQQRAWLEERLAGAAAAAEAGTAAVRGEVSAASELAEALNRSQQAWVEGRLAPLQAAAEQAAEAGAAAGAAAAAARAELGGALERQAATAAEQGAALAGLQAWRLEQGAAEASRAELSAEIAELRGRLAQAEAERGAPGEEAARWSGLEARLESLAAGAEAQAAAQAELVAKQGQYRQYVKRLRAEVVALRDAAAADQGIKAVHLAGLSSDWSAVQRRMEALHSEASGFSADLRQAADMATGARAALRSTSVRASPAPALRAT